MKYTDPSGEFIPHLIVAGVGFTTGYLTHGFSTGEWGWSAIASGGINALTSTFGYDNFFGGSIFNMYSPITALGYSGIQTGIHVANNIIFNNIGPITLINPEKKWFWKNKSDWKEYKKKIEGKKK